MNLKVNLTILRIFELCGSSWTTFNRAKMTNIRHLFYQFIHVPFVQMNRRLIHFSLSLEMNSYISGAATCNKWPNFLNKPQNCTFCWLFLSFHFVSFAILLLCRRKSQAWNDPSFSHALTSENAISCYPFVHLITKHIFYHSKMDVKTFSKTNRIHFKWQRFSRYKCVSHRERERISLAWAAVDAPHFVPMFKPNVLICLSVFLCRANFQVPRWKIGVANLWTCLPKCFV